MKKNEYVFLALLSAILFPVLFAFGELFGGIWFLVVLIVCLIKLSSLRSREGKKGLVDNLMMRGE